MTTPSNAHGAATHATKRILVIEDNPDLAYGLRNNLEIEGYEVEVAKDGPISWCSISCYREWMGSGCSGRCATTGWRCRC